MGRLIEHAKTELQIAGLLDKDSDYDGALGEGVLRLIELFASEGHSGSSASMTIDIFSKLASFQTLTSLTSNPEEWFEYEPGNWQNKRSSRIFSKDGGKTWYDLSVPVENETIVEATDTPTHREG